MPYVEVWVDDACCGDCDSAKEADRLEAKIEEAVAHLHRGDAEAALHALTNDPGLCMKEPRQIASAYEAWKLGKLPGFANYVREDAQH